MSPLLKITLYLLTVLAAAVLLSPPFYWLFEWLDDAKIFTAFHDFPFHRYFTRIAQISALVLIWPLIRWLNIRSLNELGITKNPTFWRDLGVGFAIAFVLMLILGGSYFASEVYAIKPKIGWSKLLNIALSAVVVGTIEEFLFRGVILGLAIKAFGRVSGIWLSAIIFAGMHFLRPGRGATETVTWLTGFSQLFSFMDAAPAWPLLIAGFASLLAAGLILGVVTVRTHSLALAIGIHAAWVFGQQSLGTIGKYRVKPEDAYLPWVGPNLVSGAVPTGLVPLVALALTAVAVFLYLKYVPRPTATLAEIRA